MKLRVTETTLKHIAELMENIRPLDKKECELMEQKEFQDFPLEMLNNSHALTDENGKLYAVGGIERDKGKPVGVVWLICTKHVEECPVAFLRFMKKLLAETLKNYSLLCNYVWLKNDLHVKWLKFMGAEITESRLERPNGEEFAFFYFKKDN